MLPRDLPRGEVLDVLRDEAGRFLKFVKGLVEILQIVARRFLEFEAARESLAGGLQVFDRTVTGNAFRLNYISANGYRRD